MVMQYGSGCYDTRSETIWSFGLWIQRNTHQYKLTRFLRFSYLGNAEITWCHQSVGNA